MDRLLFWVALTLWVLTSLGLGLRTRIEELPQGVAVFDALTLGGVFLVVCVFWRGTRLHPGRRS